MDSPAPNVSGSFRVLVLLLGVSSVVTQLVAIRELWCLYQGNELVLGVVLGNWLLVGGAGAWCGRRLSWNPGCGPAGLRLVCVGFFILTWIPLVMLLAIRSWARVVFLPGVMIGLPGTFGSSLVLLSAYSGWCGFLLTAACRLAVQGGRDVAAGISQVYVWDSLGSLIGGMGFTFIGARWLNHIQVLSLIGGVGMVGLMWVGAQTSWRGLTWLSRVGLVGMVGIGCWGDLDHRLTAGQVPGQRLVFQGYSPYGRLWVTETGGQYNFFENGVVLATSDHVEHAEETAHYAMSQRPEARRVLIVSGSLSGVCGEVLRYPVAEVCCVELDALVVEVARRYLPGLFDDARVQWITADGRQYLRRAQGRFDVVILDLPDPTTSLLNRFFTVECFREIHRALKPGGVLAFGIGRYENFIPPDLARLLASVHRTVHTVFAQVLMIPGRRVFFLGSDGPLDLDIAPRLSRAKITTRLVNTNYLSGTLTRDRLADLGRAVEEAGELNRDHSPVLYYLHWRHWLRETGGGWGGYWFGLILACVVGWPVLRGGRVVWSVWVSGYTALALEVVLWLSFQTCYGVLYQGLGFLVAVFMGGMALGAASLPLRWLGRSPDRPPAGRGLGRVSLALAGLSALLGASVSSDTGWDRGLMPGFVFGGGIPGVMFALAFLVGRQFSLACQAAESDAVRRASSLYTADFLGAFVGALVTSAFLIPGLGLGVTCGVIAVLNAFMGWVMLRGAKLS